MHAPATCIEHNPYELIRNARWDDVGAWLAGRESDEYAASDVQRTQAIHLWNSGRKNSAAAILARLLASDPNDVFSLRLLGALCLEEGAYDDAKVLYGHLDNLAPGDAEARLGIAEAYLGLGHLPAAKMMIWLVLAGDPTHTEALCLLAGIGVSQGAYDTAIETLKIAHDNNPAALQPISMMADTYEIQGKFNHSRALREKLVRARPNDANQWIRLADAQSRINAIVEALQSAERGVSLDPENAAGHLVLGHVYMRFHRHALAKIHFARSAELDADRAPNALAGLGLALFALGEQKEAFDVLLRALDRTPTSHPLLNALAILQERLSEHEAALISYDRMVKHHPNIPMVHFNRSILNLRLGNFEEGWAGYESRFDSGAVPLPALTTPRWDGGQTGGHLLIVWEQGFGDTLQFVRFLPLVRGRVDRTTLVCQRGLGELLRRSGLADEVIEAPLECTNFPPHDYHLPLMSLPYALRLGGNVIGRSVPYLTPDPSKVCSWAKRLSAYEGLRVGLVWSGKVTNPNNVNRMCPAEKFASLGQLPGVRLYSFIKGPDLSQLPALQNHVEVPDFGSEFQSFDDTAAALTNLDVLVSTCTSVPHLAGALGVPTFIMIPFSADWRWLTGRTDSPWYPSVTLVQQQDPGEWDDAIERIARELSQWKLQLRGAK